MAPDQRHPAPNRTDHERFCPREGWERTKTATGKSSTHHITYEIELDDGARLRTRVSRPVNRSTYGSSMWSHVLRDQLCITGDEFWACVHDGVLPARGRAAAPSQALPAELVALLLHTVRLSEDEVRAMSKDEAVARAARFWTEGR